MSAPESGAVDTPTMAAGTSIVGSVRENSATEGRKPSEIRPDEADVDLSRPVDKNAQRGEVIGSSTTLPAGVVEAGTTYDSDGNAVFEIWRPPTTADVNDEREGYR